MKKQIALLATLIAASGFTAFGQDWVEVTSLPATSIWNETGASALEASAGQFDIVWLWAASSAADSLSAVGPSANMGGLYSTAKQQVATNGVTSVSTQASTGELSSMLSGGWSVLSDENSGSGSATLGEVIVATTGARGATASFNGGAAFQVNGISSSPFEMLAIAVNPSAIVGGSLVVSDITEMGWANPFNETAGTSSTDNNDAAGEAQTGGSNPFGVTVVGVPEPTTLALAGLGGLSMLFLRRRKA